MRSKSEGTNPRIKSAMLQLDKLQTAAAVGDEAAATAPATSDPAFAVELATAMLKRANGKGKQLLIGLLIFTLPDKLADVFFTLLE